LPRRGGGSTDASPVNLLPRERRLGAHTVTVWATGGNGPGVEGFRLGDGKRSWC